MELFCEIEIHYYQYFYMGKIRKSHIIKENDLKKKSLLICYLLVKQQQTLQVTHWHKVNETIEH